jgi:hypothetical protein
MKLDSNATLVATRKSNSYIQRYLAIDTTALQDFKELKTWMFTWKNVKGCYTPFHVNLSFMSFFNNAIWEFWILYRLSQTNLALMVTVVTQKALFGLERIVLWTELVATVMTQKALFELEIFTLYSSDGHGDNTDGYILTGKICVCTAVVVTVITKRDCQIWDSYGGEYEEYSGMWRRVAWYNFTGIWGDTANCSVYF